MLAVEMTPNYLGFRISGNYDDLDKLYDAVFALSVDDYPDKSKPNGSNYEIAMSTRLLALNYELRHAYQGDRGVSLKRDALDEECARWHGVSAPKHQVVYSTEILYPEMMFYLMALERLIQLRKSWMAGRKSYSSDTFDLPPQLFDVSICHARLLQSLVLDAVKPHLSKQSFTRLCRAVRLGRDAVMLMAHQWLDVINAHYCGLTKAKRKKALVYTAEDIAGFEECEEYFELVVDLRAFAAERGCRPEDAKLNLDWPDEFDWGYPPKAPSSQTAAGAPAGKSVALMDQPASRTAGAPANVIYVDFGASESGNPASCDAATGETKEGESCGASETGEALSSNGESKVEESGSCGNTSEEVVQAFARYLCACGLSEKTIIKHVDNIAFFLDAYVIARLGETLASSHEYIGGFLGNYFIYKCMWSSPSAIDGYCASFKKFYEFAEREGLVAPGVAAEVAGILKEGKADWKRECESF